MEVHLIAQEAVIKIIPKKRNEKRQNGCLKKPYKQLRKEKLQAKEKGKDILNWMQSFREEQGEIKKHT